VAENILQGMLGTKAHFLTAYRSEQLAASQNDAVVGWIYVPFRHKVVGYGYSLNIAGTSGDVSELKCLDSAGSAMTATENPTNRANGGVSSAWVDATKREECKDAGYYKWTINTASNSTIEDAAFTLAVVAVGGK